MDANWDTIRNRILERKLENKTWASDRKQLLAIFDAAEKRGLVAGDLNQAPISNLRDIIKHAKNAIKKNDVEYLEKLFNMAVSLDTYDLRKEIGSLKLKVINYRRNHLNGEKIIKISVTEDEFAHIQINTKRLYIFEEYSN